MPQPIAYTPAANFSADEANNAGGRSTVNTSALDAELAAVATTLSGVRANLALNQRDDGEIRDERVKMHALSPDVKALLVASEAAIRGAWLTATNYALRDVVTQGGNSYICAEAHTSSTFATDLAAVRWVLLAQGGTTAAAIPFVGTETLSATNVQAAIEESDEENRLLSAAASSAVLTLAGDLADDATSSKGASLVAYAPHLDYASGLGEHLNYTFGRTDGEIAAGVTPTNWAAFPGFPERYGAVGDGVANDQAAVAACFAANEIVRLTDGAFYLINGITITAARKVVYGAGYNSGFIISGSSGSFGLKFIHASGSGTHFGAGFRGFDFRVTCKATSNKIIGIWMDNAEIDGLERVYIDLSSNTHVGTARNATFGMYGYYQQDGVFTKCHFTGGSGAYSDGLYLTGVVTLSAPNNNLFIGCRAQSSAGYGVRNEVGDGNVWLGGKIQSNGLGGWLEGDDGLGNGPSNTVIRYAGFEANGGDDVKAEITNFLYMEHNTFQSTGATNHINIAFGNNCRLEKNFSFPGKPVLISGGTGNYWDRLNAGFGARSFASGTMADAAVQDVTVSGGSPSAVSIDCSVTEYVRLDVTTTANFTVSAPTNPSDCQILTIDITNSTGTASTGTITWPASFGMAGSWVSPANTKRRSLTMRRNGTRWTEIGRSPADI